MSGTLLVVAHEGYRNGATLVLRRLLPHVIDELGGRVQVEVQTEGPLAAELRALATDHRPDAVPDVVLVNSALAADRLVRLPAGVPAVVYVHEVGEALTRLQPDALAGLRRADRVLCVSERGRADLEALGVEPARIELLPPLITAEAPSAGAIADARAELVGSSGAAKVVVACGEAAWRKGADLFVDVVRCLPADVQAAWIGRRNRAFAKQLDHDTALAGLEGRLTWFGEVTDPLALLAAADVVVLPSREDPQPLVPMEAAVVGTPTVGFDGTGLADLAAVGGAEVVPYPDAQALGALASAILDDPARGARVVDGARRVVAQERSWEVLAPRLVDVLRSVQHLGTDPAPRTPDPDPSEPT